MVKQFLEEVLALKVSGDAAERTYYPALVTLLEEAGAARVKIEARHSKVGIPDFKIENDRGELIGYIEAKDATRNLDSLNKDEDEQIASYKKEYPNLIVTNFVEFRFFEDGAEVDKIVVGESSAWKTGALVIENEARLEAGLQRFLRATIPQSRTSGQLAKLLADKGRILRKLIAEEINLQDGIDTTTEALLKAFQQTLNPSLTADEFADMYAQAIVFGLFTARLNFTAEDFNSETAYRSIPHSIPLLQKVFYMINGADAPQYIRWLIDDMAEVLDKTDMERIKRELSGAGRGRDPLFHFYEPFLAEYDARRREQLGVYYTPLPVVSYITRSVQQVLEEQFDKSEGFADQSVTLLDPAAGTMTFIAQAIALAHERYVEKNGSGGWSDRVKKHILRDFYAFELLMGPYTVGHLKVALMLASLDYQMHGQDRFPLYLTNTLDMEKHTLQTSAFTEVLSEESQQAFEIKGKMPVLVVMGNPPYSGHSANNFPWIDQVMADYKKVGSEPLGEKNPKWLNDDYVKFFRFASWKVEQAGSGVVAYITNHAWLDNPTFRGMRYEFLKTFDEIYVLNLHGSTLKKEKTPEGGRDEGVFGIKPGTAITIAIRKADHSDNPADVYYHELWGSRKDKFAFLDENDWKTTSWEKLAPKPPFNFFVAKDDTGWEEYEKGVKINDIFPVNSVGIVTARDDLTIKWDGAEVKETINRFASMDPETARTAFELGKDARDWKVELAQKDLTDSGLKEENIVPILYRPFDTRYTYYTGKSRGFHCMPRGEVMKNLLKPNMALISTKQYKPESELLGVYVTNIISGHKAVNVFDINYVFPLYVFEDGEQTSILGNLRTNIDYSKLPKEFAGRSPEEVFYYVYAMLYSPWYRKEYAEFLKTDFPRVPFTGDLKLADLLIEQGKRLVGLHLLKVDDLNIATHKYQGAGDNLVSDVKHEGDRVYINAAQYFENVGEVWDYQVGGYQVLAKWLKDRKGRTLTEDERTMYRKIICSLEETMEIQARLDNLSKPAL